MEGEDNLFLVSPRYVPHGSATHASSSNTQNRLATRAVMIWDTFAGCPAARGTPKVSPLPVFSSVFGYNSVGRKHKCLEETHEIQDEHIYRI